MVQPPQNIHTVGIARESDRCAGYPDLLKYPNGGIVEWWNGIILYDNYEFNGYEMSSDWWKEGGIPHIIPCSNTWLIKRIKWSSPPNL